MLVFGVQLKYVWGAQKAFKIFFFAKMPTICVQGKGCRIFWLKVF